MSTAKTLIDAWLLGTADKWETALSSTPPDWTNLDGIPASPGNVSFLDLLDEVRSRVVPAPRRSALIDVAEPPPGTWGAAQIGVPNPPSAWELEQSLRAHPDLFLEIVEALSLAKDITLAPWDDHLDGMGTSGVYTPGDGPFSRQTPGEDNLIAAQVLRNDNTKGSWGWYVFQSNEDSDMGGWPISSSRLGYSSRIEAMRACDQHLLENGYYLKEPTCEIDAEVIEDTYGGIAPPPGQGVFR